MVLITFTNDKPRLVKVMSTILWSATMNFGGKCFTRFFNDIKTRICETLALRKDFCMIGTTLSIPGFLEASTVPGTTKIRWFVLETAGFSESHRPKIPRYWETAGFSECHYPPKILRFLETAGFSKPSRPKIPRYWETAGFSEPSRPKIPQLPQH
jgi:hypothetical protein